MRPSETMERRRERRRSPRTLLGRRHACRLAASELAIEQLAKADEADVREGRQRRARPARSLWPGREEGKGRGRVEGWAENGRREGEKRGAEWTVAVGECLRSRLCLARRRAGYLWKGDDASDPSCLLV